MRAGKLVFVKDIHSCKHYFGPNKCINGMIYHLYLPLHSVHKSRDSAIVCLRTDLSPSVKSLGKGRHIHPGVSCSKTEYLF